MSLVEGLHTVRGVSTSRSEVGDVAKVEEGHVGKGISYDVAYDAVLRREVRLDTRPCSHSTESAFNPRGAFCRISFKHLAAGSFYRMGLPNGDKSRFKL